MRQILCLVLSLIPTAKLEDTANGGIGEQSSLEQLSQLVDIQSFRPVKIFGHGGNHWLPSSVDELLHVAAGGGIIVFKLNLFNYLVIRPQ